MASERTSVNERTSSDAVTKCTQNMNNAFLRPVITSKKKEKSQAAHASKVGFCIS